MAKSKTATPAADTTPPSVVAAMMAVNPVATQAWVDLMTECGRFAASRLQSDLDTQKAILACRTPSDLMKVQSAFLQGAMEDYASELARLYNMTSKAAEDVMDDVRAGRARPEDDVPL